MAQFVKDLVTGSNDPLVRAWFARADTYAEGEFLRAGLADGSTVGTVISCDLDDDSDGQLYRGSFVGISNEAITTDGTIDNYNLDPIQVIYNPWALWEAEIPTGTAITATGAGPVFTCGSGLGHPQAGGSWIYGVSGSAAGELNVVEDSTVVGTDCTLVVADSGTAYADTDTFILIPRQGMYAVALLATQVSGGDIDAGYQVAGGQYGYGAVILDNFITTDDYTKQPLRMVQEDNAKRKTMNLVTKTGLNTAYRASHAKFETHINLTKGSIWVTTIEPS